MHLHYICTIILGWMAIFHPFYISLTEAKYNPVNQNFEISQKLFWDDLETALSEEYGKKIDFLHPGNQKELDRMVEDYLLKHNHFTINGQKVNLNYLGYEIEEEATWFYFESAKVKRPKTVQIRNTVFLDNFESQQHIINVYVEKKPKTLILDRKKNSGNLNFI